MLDCILIDHERPALRELERLLAAHANCLRVVASFQRTKDLPAAVSKLQPAVAFVGIHMPALNGLELAAALRDRLPGLAVVFVTAHRQYAVEAFSQEAIDYLLKPLTPARLAQTVARLRRHFGLIDERIDPLSYPVRIRCFGGLHVDSQAGPLRWHSSKTRELFAYLLQHRSVVLSRERLLEDLYPDGQQERANQRLYNDRYQLRRQLQAAGIDEACLRIEGCRIETDDTRVWCDVEHYERLLADAVRPSISLAALRQAADMVGGPYFQDADWPWAETRREKLRASQQHLLCRLAETDIEKGETALAEASMLRALENDPYDEAAMTRLVRLYRDSGRAMLAQRHYETYRQRLDRDLQVLPGAALRKLAEAISA